MVKWKINKLYQLMIIVALVAAGSVIFKKVNLYYSIYSERCRTCEYFKKMENNQKVNLLDMQLFAEKQSRIFYQRMSSKFDMNDEFIKNKIIRHDRQMKTLVNNEKRMLDYFEEMKLNYSKSAMAPWRPPLPDIPLPPMGKGGRSE